MSITKKDLEKMFKIQEEKSDCKFDDVKQMLVAQEEKFNGKFEDLRKELKAEINDKFEESQRFMGTVAERLEDDIKIIAEMFEQNTEDIAEIKQDIKDIKEDLSNKVNRSECIHWKKSYARA